MSQHAVTDRPISDAEREYSTILLEWKERLRKARNELAAARNTEFELVAKHREVKATVRDKAAEVEKILGELNQDLPLFPLPT